MLSRFVTFHTKVRMHSTSPMESQVMSCEICFMVDDDFRQHCTQDALLQLYWCFRVIPQRHQILTQRCQLLLLRFTKRLGRLSRSRKSALRPLPPAPTLRSIELPVHSPLIGFPA